MRHGPDDGLDWQEELQVDCNLLHHQGGYRAGNINLRVEEPAGQTLINVVAANSDVARMVHRSMALAIYSRRELIEGMHMKRSKQHHRHIDHQDGPCKPSLPARDIDMYMPALHRPQR